MNFVPFLFEILFANNVDPDQMPHYVASDLGLHCLPMTILPVSRLEWVKEAKAKNVVQPVAGVLW